MNNSNSY